MLSTQFCPTCGAANEAAQIHCFACGHSLSTSTDALATSDSPLLHERYQLGAMLGSGGFSTVYRARDVQAGRDVAIKQISLHGLSAEEAIEATDTFNREANVLSALQHPQIPQIYDQFSDQEHWYLVLQYLEGPTLETYLETRIAQGKPLQFDEVLEMALQLGDVLNYLHTRQPPVIFRDLKPSNIIRTPPQGTLCLIDFGIARRFHPGQKRDTQTLGSLGYAAPEQYGRAQTTPRSDIYSLGALLHQLLSGDDPAESPSGLKPLHLHTEPEEEKLSELVQRMLSPDPEQRPGDMGEVIATLAMVQQQCIAQPAVRVWQAPAPQNQPSSPPGWQQWQQVQVQVPSSPSSSASQAPASPGRRKMLIGLGGVLAVIGVSSILGKMLFQSTSQAVATPDQIPTIPPAQSLPTPQPQEGFQKLSGGGDVYLGHVAPVLSIAWSPNGQYIASSSDDSTVQVWDATTGKTILIYQHPLADGEIPDVTSVAWSPNSQYIASGADSTTVQVWEATSGKTVLTHQGLTNEFGYMGSVAWSPNGQYIASGSDDSTVQVWDATTGTTLLTYRGHKNGVRSVAWSPNSQYIVSGSQDNTAQIWEATSGNTVLTYRKHKSYVNSVAWSPDGQHIVSGSGDGTTQIWEATSGNTVLTYQVPTNANATVPDANAVTAVAWSPNGKYIVSGFLGVPAQVWDATSGNTVLTYQGLTNYVECLIWSPDGKRIAFGSSDHTVQVWNAP